MARSFTPEEIKELQQFLLENPIDPAYDEECEAFSDSLDPAFLRQLSARNTYDILESIGALPEELKQK